MVFHTHCDGVIEFEFCRIKILTNKHADSQTNIRSNIVFVKTPYRYYVN